MGISDDTFRKIVTAACDLHRHRQESTFPHWLARVLARTFACDSAMLVSVDVARRTCAVACSPGLAFPVDDRTLFELHEREHPFVAKCAASRSAGAFRLSDLCAPARFANTALHHLVYGPLGIRHQLLMLVASPDLQRRAIVLNRAEPEFSEEDRACLEVLWPHIVLAQRNFRRSRRTQESGAPLPGVRENSGVMILGDECEVTLCSEQARLWLAEYFSGTSLAGRVGLPRAVLEWARGRLEVERSGRRLRVVRRDPLVIARGARCLTIDMVVDHGKGLHLVTMAEADMNAPAFALGGLNLTPRETEVLSWVSQGKTDREVGMILMASTRTVQKHVEHIFQKLGVENRTGAILRAWQFARDAPDFSRPTRPSSRC
jgi:DNA-binding CsgD family transcriptional regulator